MPPRLQDETWSGKLFNGGVLRDALYAPARRTGSKMARCRDNRFVTRIAHSS